VRSGGDLAHLSDSLARARREYALAVDRGDHTDVRTLSLALRQLERLIATAAQDYHRREGC